MYHINQAVTASDTQNSQPLYPPLTAQCSTTKTHLGFELLDSLTSFHHLSCYRIQIDTVSNNI